MKMTVAEKHYADILTSQGIKYIFPVPMLNLDATRYRPDFYLPEKDLYIEVVGTRQAYHANKHKYEEFRRTHHDKNFQIVDRYGKIYPSLENFVSAGSRNLKKIKSSIPKKREWYKKKVFVNGEETVTIKEAMKILNVTARITVGVLIDGKKVIASLDDTKKPSVWRIEKKSLLEYKKKRDMRKELLK